VAAAVCIRLGFWQLDRLEQRRATNAAIDTGLAEPPLDATELLRSGTPDDLAYRPATASGTFDPSAELVLYGRSLGEQPGDHVLTPLVLDDGTRLLVDRGWIPFAPERELPLTGEASAATGRVEVTGVLMASETGDTFGDQDPAGATVVRAVNLDELRVRDPGLAPVYMLLGSQEPTQALPVLVDVERPGEGPHLSYAIQWFAFAAIALVGAAFVLRRRSTSRGR
jgi:surfeit locus 1 family protein